MKILLLTKYGRLGASSRLRTFQYISYLQKENIDVTVMPLINDKLLSYSYKNKGHNKLGLLLAYLKRAIFLFFNKKKFDLIWVEKEIYPWAPYIFEKLSLGDVSYVLDYDDAIFHNYDQNVNPLLNLLLSEKIPNLIKNSNAVFVGNDYLYDKASSYGASRIIFLPTVIDIDRYSEGIKHQVPIIVWIGSPSTVKYLNLLSDIFIKLRKEREFSLRVIGANYISPCDNLNIENLAWEEISEVDYIKECDIGIMPLKNNLWEKGKCGYKLIQYMGCGLPVVASDVGANAKIVSMTEGGFVASNDEEWLYHLRELLDSQELRNRLGNKARQNVHKYFSVQSTSTILIDHLIRIIEEAKK